MSGSDSSRDGMQAIILAAGVGKRLMPLTGQRPKCLIEIGGKSLLERYLDAFRALGIEDITFVLGHLKEMILERLNGLGRGLKFHYIINQDYTRGSITSLWCARERLKGDVLIMDADVLFHPVLLERLVHSPKPSCFLMDENFTDSGEEMKLFAQGDRVIAISKKNTARSQYVGEGVGFLKLSSQHCPILREVLEDFVREGRLDAEYEEALDRFLRRCEVGFEKVEGAPWIEIDFLEDIEWAEREILPRLVE